MTTATKEKPVATGEKPLAVLKKKLQGFKRHLTGLKLSNLKKVSLLKDTVPLLSRKARTHLEFIAKLHAWSFIGVVGLWVAAAKVLLVPIAVFLNWCLFSPLGIKSLFETTPALRLTDAITAFFYEVTPLDLRWASLARLDQIVCVGLLFPLICTVAAQLVPLEVLSKSIRAQKRRLYLSVGLMGLLTLLFWGQSVLLFTGAVMGLLLAYTFLHWKRRTTVLGACYITYGVHVLANVVFILFQRFHGGM